MSNQTLPVCNCGKWELQKKNFFQRQLDDDSIADEVADNGGMMIRMGERAKSGRYPGLILKCVAPKGPTMTIPWSRILPNDEDYCSILE